MRKSNVELLRIVLFAMVVAIHVSSPYLNAYHHVGTVNWQTANFLDGFSRICINGFVLISGYFMCNSRGGVWERIKSLLTPLPFYLLPYLYFYVQENDNFGKAVFLMIRDIPGNRENFYHMWYVGVIMIVYALSGYFNRLIQSMSQSEMKKALVALIIVFSGISSVNYILGYGLFDTELFDARLGQFIMMYFIGAYIRLYYKVLAKPVKLFTAFLCCNVAVVAFGALYNSRFSPLFPLSFLKGFILTYPFNEFIGGVYNQNFIVIVASSVLLFVFFLSLDIHSGVINYLGKRTYGAYVIHAFWINFLGGRRIISPFVRHESSSYPLYCLLFIVMVCILSLTVSAMADFVISRVLRRN